MSRLRFWPDPMLRRVSRPVSEFGDGLTGLVATLLDEMYGVYGRGMAAPQIGVLRRVFVLDAHWKTGNRQPRAFVNPEILWASDKMAVHEETCLSIPDQPRRVARPELIRLTWQDTEGDVQEAEIDGFQAVCVQHELDHLNGIVVLDHPEAP